MNSEHVARSLVTQPQSSAELARTHGLDQGFCELVQRAFNDPAFEARVSHSDDTDDVAPIFWKRWTRRPLVFVSSTLIIWKAVQLLTLVIIQFLLSTTVQTAVHPIHTISFLVLLCFVGMLHAACYFRHIMVRWVLYGTLIFGAVQAIGGGLEKWLMGGSLAKVAFASIGYFFSVFPYAIVMLPCAVLGGYLRVRRGQKMRTQLSRQQLIERLFDVRHRLTMVQTGVLEDRSIRHRPWFVNISQNLYKYCVYGSLVMFGLMLGFEALSGPAPLVGGILSALLSLVTILVVVAIGFIAARPGRAVVATLIYSFVAMPLVLVPVGRFGWKYLVSNENLFALGFGSIFTIFVAIVASVGASIEAQAQRDRMLKANAPGLLQAELQSLEAQLRPQARRICVMDVDAYRSSLMKAESDAFEAEWSFREYQNLITRVCSRYLGSIHSTAGDGAVVGFPSSAQALDAAIALQAEIAVFNMKVNRLGLPFIIRIGLHTGDLQGELDQVQFTEVIDVAAHIQKAVPVGTIGVSERTLENLDHERFSLLGTKVDGYDVYVLNNVLGPTEQVHRSLAAV